MKVVCAVCLTLYSIFLTLVFLPEAHADGRVALVIGNAAYSNAPPLRNSRNDADDMSAQLRRLGFDVVDGRDLDNRGMRAALARFAQKLTGTDAALFYYSGHGLQIDGQNYLAPVDAQVDGDSVMAFELVKLDDVIEALGYTAGTRLLVLDACRSNPFAKALAQRSGSRGGEITRGLARIERTQGMLIAYATQPNAVAADGTGRNSPFTSALVREMQEPGVEVGALFRHVAVKVNRDTHGQQTPELSVSLLGDFYLNPQESDLDAFRKLGPSTGVDAWKAFIEKYPSSSLVDFARARIDAIENVNARDRLVNSYEEKQRQLRLDLEQAEAGFRQAREELARLRQQDETKQAEERLSANAPAESLAAKQPEPAKQPDAEQQNQRDRLANQVAALEANKARLDERRLELERAMRERLAKAQSDREQAEQRLELETARLPPAARESKTVAAQTRQKSTPNCQEINARAQLGDISETDRVALRQCH